MHGYYSGVSKTFDDDLSFMPLAYWNLKTEIPETLEVILSTLPNPCIGQYTYGNEFLSNSIQNLQ